MNDPLDALDQKIDQVLALCQTLRGENLALRTRVAGLEGENRQLQDKINTARARLEGLVARLPQE
jgi:cell division protein ZapB